MSGADARGSNQSGMRAYNERLVLSLIRQAGPLPKAVIARMTGLSAQTVSVIMRALEKDGLLLKGEPIRGKVGQPSVPMALDPDGALFLGLKIGRRGTEVQLVDFLGGTRFQARKAHPYPTPDGVVGFACDTIDDVLGRITQEQRARVAGLGIAMPFRLWDWRVSADHDGEGLEAWRGFDIGAALGAKWDVPIYLCNDASAACSAELVFGAKDKPRDFLYFYIGYFVGGGLVLDSRLYTGKSGNAAALGSMPIRAKGGDNRQLVDVASLVTLEDMLLSAGCRCDAIWERRADWNLPAGVVTDWIDLAADGLAQAIVASTCLIDVETVLIDGSLPTGIRAELVERTAARMRDITVPGIAFPDVRQGSVGSDAKTLGATSLPLSDRFLVDRDAFLKG